MDEEENGITKMTPEHVEVYTELCVSILFFFFKRKISLPYAFDARFPIK